MKSGLILRTILCFVLALYITQVSSQSVITVDGVNMGSRKEFIDSCVKSYMDATGNSREARAEAKKYCNCVCDSLFIKLHSEDIMAAFESNTFSELLGTDENLAIITRCMENNVLLKDDYTFGKGGSSDFTDLQKKVAVKSCVDELKKDTTMSIEISEVAAVNYCQCAIDKMYSRGTTYKELQDIENENSGAYNEILMPCIELLLNQDLEYQPEAGEIESDVIGDSAMITVPLMDLRGQSFRVNLTIGQVSRYFLFDTGASDLIISQDLERELLLNGTLKKEHYLEKTTYKLANNKMVEGQKVIIPEIIIGDFVVKNTVAGIIEGGSLLCGRSFLNKFSRHEVDTRNKSLILYK